MDANGLRNPCCRPAALVAARLWLRQRHGARWSQPVAARDRRRARWRHHPFRRRPRSYGYGEAEALLGEALAGKRDRVVIASKFGLARAARGRGAARALKPLAQRLVATVPGARPCCARWSAARRRRADRFSVGVGASLARPKPRRAQDRLSRHPVPARLRGRRSDRRAAPHFLDAKSPPAKSAPTASRPRSRRCCRSIARARRCDALPVRQQPLRARNAERLPRRRAALYRAQPVSRRRPAARPRRRRDLHRLMLAGRWPRTNVAVVLCSMLDEAHLRANLATVERPRFSAAEMLGPRFAAGRL